MLKKFKQSTRKLKREWEWLLAEPKACLRRGTLDALKAWLGSLDFIWRTVGSHWGRLSRGCSIFLFAQSILFLLHCSLGPVFFLYFSKDSKPFSLLFNLFSLISAHLPSHISTLWSWLLLLSWPGPFPLPCVFLASSSSPWPLTHLPWGRGWAELDLRGKGYMVGTGVMVTEPGGYPLFWHSPSPFREYPPPIMWLRLIRKILLCICQHDKWRYRFL